MGLFSHHKSGIMKSDYSVVLGAKVEGAPGSRRLTHLFYTGHDGSHGVMRALAVGGEVIWQAKFASEHDVRDGLLVMHGDTIVLHDPSGKALVAHDLWTGAEKWRTPVGPSLVSRLGIDKGDIVVITVDHTVHGISLETGKDTPRGQVMTDEASSDTINATKFPVNGTFSDGSCDRSKLKDWSYQYRAGKVDVLKRDWAGTTTWAVGEVSEGSVDRLREVGNGSYEGAITLGDLQVLAFDLKDGDGSGERRDLYVLAQSPLEVLAVLRENKDSDFCVAGDSSWKGKL
jgi:outer membrane protein assembly factor BamB